jgi:hypothetical protein
MSNDVQQVSAVIARVAESTAMAPLMRHKSATTNSVGRTPIAFLRKELVVVKALLQKLNPQGTHRVHKSFSPGESRKGKNAPGSLSAV